MTPRMELFLLAAIALFFALAGAAAYSFVRLREISNESWEHILGRLETVDHRSIARIVLDLEHVEDLDGVELASPDVWRLVGGFQGLNRIENNCRVLVDLAAYVQRSYPEAVVIAEELRLSARQIEWHLSRLRGAQADNVEAVSAPYVQQALSLYREMARNVVVLYELAGMKEVAALRTALQS